MRRAFIIALLIAGSMSVLPAQQAAAFRGHIVDAATGAPIVRARIGQPRPPVPPGGDISTRPPEPPPVLTDEHGDFVLPSRPTAIDVSKAGYAHTKVNVAATATRLDLQLTRAAAIGGRVIDAGGAPVTTVFVGVFALTDTGVSTQPVGNAQTNDLGEFRVGGLPAGSYRVRFTDDPAVPGVDVDVRSGEDVEIPQVVGAAPCPDVSTPQLDTSGPGRVRLGQPPSQSGIVRGRVTTVSNTPLCAVVTLRAARMPQVRVTTDARGRYSVENLPPGDWSIEAGRAGYSTGQYGQSRPLEAGKTVDVKAGSEITNADIVLTRGGAVSGSIADERGEPIEGVLVRASLVTMLDGRRVAMNAPGSSAQKTDDRGRYRLYNLQPGKYVVSATTDEYPTVSGSGAAGGGDAPVFYPGTVDVNLALPLDVPVGRDLGDIDLTFLNIQTVTVSGVALNDSGKPIAGAVLLARDSRTSSMLMEPRQARVAPDGSFAFDGVPPGDYVLQAMSPRQGAAPDFGVEFVHVEDVPPPPVQLQTSPGPTLVGRIVREGAEVAANAFMVMPFPADLDRTPQIGFGTMGVTVQTDGAYRAAGMSGVRRFTLMNAPAGWYLKSVTLDGRNVTDEAVDLGLKPVTYDNVQIVVSNAGATIDGDVRDNDSAVDGYTLLLFSTDRSRWFRNSRFLKAVRPGADGRFHASGIAPDEYFIAAVDRLQMSPNGAAGEWQDPGVLEAIAAGARRVSLGEHQQATFSLTLQRR
jgi:hypothetical protein